MSSRAPKTLPRKMLGRVLQRCVKRKRRRDGGRNTFLIGGVETMSTAAPSNDAMILILTLILALSVLPLSPQTGRGWGVRKLRPASHAAVVSCAEGSSRAALCHPWATGPPCCPAGPAPNYRRRRMQIFAGIDATRGDKAQLIEKNRRSVQR